MNKPETLELVSLPPTKANIGNIHSQEDWREIKCAYCNGSGRDRWGLLSELSACSACGGRGRQRIRVPFRRCGHCGGSGVHPHLRVTCTSCGGIGSVHVEEPATTCPACQGKGQDPRSELNLTCITCGGTGWLSAQQPIEKETHHE